MSAHTILGDIGSLRQLLVRTKQYEAIFHLSELTPKISEALETVEHLRRNIRDQQARIHALAAALSPHADSDPAAKRALYGDAALKGEA